MNQSFFTAAVGAQRQQERLNVQANNIANINTYGFKAERPTFSSLMYGNMNGIDNAKLPRGTGARLEATETDFSSGSFLSTGRAQDYAINGLGFFALIDPATNEVSFTRDGSFTLSQSQRADKDGKLESVTYLSDGEGRFVLNDEGRPIEGTDTATDLRVGVFDFINREGMLHVGGNRFLPTEQNGPVRLGSGTAQRGMLEASNADLATELTQVMEAQRSYSYALKMVQTSDDVETTINGLRG